MFPIFFGFPRCVLIFSMVLVESHESSPTLATFMRCDRAGDHKIADPQLEICTGEGQKKGPISGWWLTYPSEKYQSMGRIVPYIMEK